MPYPEKLQQKHLNGVMDRIGIPDKDDYGKKLSFTGRVDLLIARYEKLNEDMQEARGKEGS